MKSKAGLRVTLLVVGSLGVLSALILLCLLNPPTQPKLLQTQHQSGKTILHVLTPHERQLFRLMQRAENAETEHQLISRFTYSRKLSHALKTRKIKTSASAFRGNMLADNEASPSRMTEESEQPAQENETAEQDEQHAEESDGRQAEESSTSENEAEGSPCVTPEDCYQRSFVDDDSSLAIIPTYDDDMPEMISAMQQQDKMILDQEEQKEKRAKLGDKAPPLKKVQCGDVCWKKRAVWCCRED